ncbi:hypothetical protein HDU87_003886 [Geranomyces variabilis]|uniref:FAS1 domain-containing protein n=1 Tax=Geranomyces variabilis TaxID=109894 RepID=A0AAD5TSX3_9FUNG|nr:hypothetical protein HDU87_003886 [Geranomyces variabilis]
MRATTFLLPLLGLARVALSAPSFVSQYELDAGGALRSGDSILDRLREDKRFSCFVEHLEKEKGLRDDLERSGQTTLFAPTNEAFRRAKKEWELSEKDIDMKSILQYHIAPESKITSDCLHAGALIPTGLRLKTLGDRHQRLRVFKFADRTWLNMMSQVMGSEVEASNGRIFAVDGVLVPPSNVGEMLSAFPTMFSTSALAIEHSGLRNDISRKNGLTVFAPSNNAWKALGLANLKYLFSCMGQEMKERSDKMECRGSKDLRRIVENMISDKTVAYSTDMMHEQKMSLKTWAGETIEIQSKERKGRRGSGSGGHQDVRDYNFVIGNGDATIQFTDLLASNAAIHIPSRVLVPENVRLPHGDRMMEMEMEM